MTYLTNYINDNEDIVLVMWTYFSPQFLKKINSHLAINDLYQLKIWFDVLIFLFTSINISIVPLYLNFDRGILDFRFILLSVNLYVNLVGSRLFIFKSTTKVWVNICSIIFSKFLCYCRILSTILLFIFIRFSSIICCGTYYLYLSTLLFW